MTDEAEEEAIWRANMKAEMKQRLDRMGEWMRTHAATKNKRK